MKTTVSEGTNSILNPDSQIKSQSDGENPNLAELCI